MNIQKIYKALTEDEGNSAVGIILSELENQGYSVLVNDVPITSEAVFNGEKEDIEALNELKISLLKAETIEQEFYIEFVEFHDFIIKNIPKD